MSADILKIGKTTYHKIRKGPQQYCIVEGKRLSELEFVWQVCKDSNGKVYFRSGTGVRRWHLPDVYMSEQEWREQEKTLKKLREKKAMEDGEHAAEHDGEREEDGMGRRDADDDGESSRGITFADRDAAAREVTLIRAWEAAESRRPVIKYVKMILAPFFTQGLIDEADFSLCITTLTREFCSQKTSLGDKERVWLRGEALSMAKGRIAEQEQKKQLHVVNEELDTQVAKLELEKRQLKSELQTLRQGEEKMKEELLKLREHKQDVLLHGFKRLTKTGLTQAYWERWITYKNVVEAQLHVRSRERRTIQMANTISHLEMDLKESEERAVKLHNRVKKAEGRDVMAIMLKRAGLQTLSKFYLVWKRYSSTARQERMVFDLRNQLDSCPTCELRAAETQRLHARFARISQMLLDETKKKELHEEHCLRLQHQLSEVTERTELLQQTSSSANKAASNLSKKLVEAEKKRAESATLIGQLRDKIDQLQFEQEERTRRDIAAPKDVRERDLISDSPHLKPSYRSPSRQNQTKEKNMASGAQLSEFYMSQSNRSAVKLQRMFESRSKKDDPQPTKGKVGEDIEAALAPLVHNRVVDEEPQYQVDTVYVGSEIRSEARGLDVQKERAHRPTQLFPPRMQRDSSPLLNSSSSDSSVDSSTDSSSSSSSDTSQYDSHDESGAANEAHDVKDDVEVEPDKCKQCGLRMAVAAFCPKDGTRHRFTAYLADAIESQNADRPNVINPSIHMKPRNDDTIAKGSATADSAIDPSKFLRLAPSLDERKAEAEASAGVVEMHQFTGGLRASLELNARTYKQTGFRSNTGVRVEEPRINRQHELEVAEYVRRTRITTESITAQRGAASDVSSRGVRSIDRSLFAELRDGASPDAKPKGKSTKWGQVFDYNDVTNGTLGVSTSQVDHAYGIFRADSARGDAAIRRPQTYSGIQHSTPNIQGLK